MTHLRNTWWEQKLKTADKQHLWNAFFFFKNSEGELLHILLEEGLEHNNKTTWLTTDEQAGLAKLLPKREKKTTTDYSRGVELHDGQVPNRSFLCNLRECRRHPRWGLAELSSILFHPNVPKHQEAPRADTRVASAQGSPEVRLASQSTAWWCTSQLAGMREGTTARAATHSHIRRECKQSMKRCKLVSRFRMQRGQK
jgi:hypothetical protein